MGVQAWRLWGAAVFVLLVGVAGTSWAKSDELSALNDQATKLYLAGKYSEAVPIAQHALALAEKLYGPDHPGVATSLNNLARLYQAQGRYAEAEPLFKRSLAIYEKALGPDHPDVAAALNNLAALYKQQGRYAEAEPNFKRSLAIREKALGPDHPDVAQSLNNLAALYDDEGRYGEAEPLYKRALAIYEKALGPDHPDVATSLNNLARLYRVQGRYAEAEPLFKRSLAIYEKALGSEHPTVATDLNNVAELYQAQRRYAEAEPLIKRSLAIYEKALGPDHPDVAASLNDLASLYQVQGRYAEAEPLFKRSLAIREKALGPDHPGVARALNDLAKLYYVQGRYDAEPLYKRALAIYEKALGPDHPGVARTLNDLAKLYQVQGRYAEAEPLFKRSLLIYEKALGPDHPDVATSLNNLALLYFAQSDWARAADYWRRGTSVIMRRTERGTAVVGKALTGKGKSEAEQQNYEFWGVVKATYRLAEAEPATKTELAAEMFETAQWAQGSEAAASLAQMAARGATGDPALVPIVRERQDRVAEWQKRDGQRTAAVSQPPDKRDKAAEAANTARMTEIDARITEIDKRLAQDFPDYSALASPKPLSVEQVQANLAADEALVLFLDTPERKPTPDETFIWVVTKTGVLWVRSELGTPSLKREVAALRCGLDYDGSWGAPGSRCAELLKTSYSDTDYDAGKPLPFDINRAHDLYNALFGQIEDVIKDKGLLIVPSGALTQLPFQVLVTQPPKSAGRIDSSPKPQVGWLGVEVKDLPQAAREAPRSEAGSSVIVVKPRPNSPSEKAGLMAGDVLLSLDGEKLTNIKNFVQAIGKRTAGAQVELRLLRGGNEKTITATLGVNPAKFLEPKEAPDVSWLIRDHALTVLPSVSSLKALRVLAKASQASRPLIGFGNPLLDGAGAGDLDWAKAARAKQSCSKPLEQQIASLRGVRRGVLPLKLRGGLADVAQIRLLVPLPETADELCAVAHDAGVGDEDIRLGARATETEVKHLSQAGELARYRLIYFATHGTLAGQISGTAEPGLLLTPPDKATATDDGYLSASEIAGLKLDADWVILSACNTAAGSAEGAEALSGLARAFFYAGARALLVSHWSVYSDATVKLITNAIGTMAADKSIGRAEGMRRSMLTLIDKGDPIEAHPAYWAPFVVVGEGAAAR